MSANDMLDNLWQIVSTGHNSTNCVMPKYVLANAVKSGKVQLPLIFKVTNPQTNQYAICAADEYYDTEEGDRLAMVPQMIINELQLQGLSSIELINNSPDLIPPRAKTIYLEPQDELFYKVSDPKKILENTLKYSYIYGVNYMIPIKTKNKIIYIKVNKIIDVNDKETRFANINNIDLNVEFLPLPQAVQNQQVASSAISPQIPIQLPQTAVKSDEKSQPSTGVSINGNVVIKKKISLSQKPKTVIENKIDTIQNTSNDNGEQ